MAFTYCGVNFIDTRTVPPSVTVHNLTPEGAWHPFHFQQREDLPLLKIWGRQETAYRPDIQQEDLYGERISMGKFGLRALADAPFSHGTLAISSPEPDAFSEHDLQMLQEMAALLSEGFQRLDDLQNLEHRAREAEALANAITVVARTPALEEVFAAVVREAAQLTSSERVTLFLYEEDAGVLVPRAQVGHEWESYRHIRLQPGEDLSGQVFATGTPQLYQANNPFTQKLRPENKALLERAVQSQQWASGGAVPLRLGERVIGTLAVRSETRTFTQHDLELLARLGQQAALAIERASHLQDLEREVAERRQAEAALRLAQFTIDNTSEAVFWFGPDGRFFYVNEAACRSLGYTREELAALSIGDIDPDFSRKPWPETWRRIQQQSQPRSRETRHRAKGGRLFPVEITATYLQFDGREFVCTFARDITARTQLEAQLRQSQKMEAVGQLTAGIAHNFNNMLQVISGNLHLLHDQVPAALEVHLADAEQSAGRAADMVRQLMVFARPAGTYHPQPLDLAALLHHILAICRQTFDQRLQFEVHIAPQLPLAQGYTGQLEQVLLNLLLNARDALEAAANPAPRLRASLQLATPADLPADLESGSYLHLQLSDNGVGMDPDTQARIFEPFFTTKPVGKGTGLGLATVYAIVREHQGRILCTSKRGEGTTFSLLLPARSAAAPAAAPAAKSTSLPRGTETLLLIDDEELVRRTLGRGLQRAGYRVLEGANGEEGLAIVQREGKQLALVLLDLSMPGLSGLEVLERLGQLETRPRVVLLTGYAADPSQYAGADEVLQKPLKIADLVHRVRQLLDR
ncbi:MAG: GAF domain-containing protein [Candidatus Latescibacteria bacterium]|nr:GAF domain-containing protein [Candidatus Latescibacterota bacterium]